MSDPVSYVTYDVYATDNLAITPMQKVGSYVADASGVITIPAADIAPYVGTDAGFIDVQLPAAASLNRTGKVIDDIRKFD